MGAAWKEIQRDSDGITGFPVDTDTGVPRLMGIPGAVVARAGSPPAISFVPPLE